MQPEIVPHDGDIGGCRVRCHQDRGFILVIRGGDLRRPSLVIGCAANSLSDAQRLMPGITATDVLGSMLLPTPPPVLWLDPLFREVEELSIGMALDATEVAMRGIDFGDMLRGASANTRNMGH